MTNWNENKPSASDKLSEFPSMVTTNAVAFREGISKHFFWTDSSGLSAGEPRLSDGSPGPGSARAFYGLQSEVSGSKNGRLMVTSDTSRLFAVPSGASSLLGSARAVISDATVLTGSQSTVPSFVTITAGTRWLVQSGSVTGQTSTAQGNVNFTTAYGAAPSIIVTPIVSTATVHAFRIAAPAINTSGFSFLVTVYGSATSYGFYWRSKGTVSL